MVSKETIMNLVSSSKTAFIASVDEEGFPNQKAMLAPRKIEGNALYFTTNTSSMRVCQYAANDKSSVYFYKRGMYKYEGVMLLGKMEVLTDQKSKDEIWQSGDTMYYPLGVTDPDYCALKFTFEKCRYYCNFKSHWVEI